jgi:hypothetical protein
MPRWIYTRPPECCHPTELEVARKLNRLPDSWIIRWGFHYLDFGTSREGDFLVFGPDGGLLVLEVKTVLRLFSATGRWEGETGSDSPKFQLDAEWKGVIHELQTTCGGTALPYVAKAICVPGESIAADIPTYQGIPRSELIDQRDLAHFTSCWKEIFQGRIRVPFDDACAAFMKTFGAELRDILHFVKDTDSLLLRQLSLDYEVLDMLVDNAQLFVSGGVGSGKTWMALEHAHRLAVAGRKVLFLCYNLNLAYLLKQIVAKRPSPDGSVSVMAWEELAKDILAKGGIAWAAPDPDARSKVKEHFYSEEVPFLLCELLTSGGIAPCFDALIVDEAQDHDTQFPDSIGNAEPGGWWRIYHALLREGEQAPMGIYFDTAQRPFFRPDSFSPAALRTCAPNAAKVRLLKTLRYTRQMLRFLQQMKSEATDSLIQGLYPGGELREGPDVQFHAADTAECTVVVHQIIEKWVDDGFCRPNEVLILSRNGNPLEHGAFKGTRTIGNWSVAPSGHEADISISSFNKAKGLDSLAVIMIDTEPFDQLGQIDQVGYWMAASRARQLLAIVHK